MSTGVSTVTEINTKRYEAVLRISEALSACRQPEEFAKILADQLGEFLCFQHLDVVVFKENSSDIEWRAWGKGHLPFPADMPLEEFPGWHVVNKQEPLYIADWAALEGFPRAKAWAEKIGVILGSVVLVPLTTPHRRLGMFGIVCDLPNAYSLEDIGFLRMIARVVAFAIDDGLNLRRAQAAQHGLQHQNDRLQLLLNLTNRITSNLELREVLRATAGNIRELMRCDAVAIMLYDGQLEKFRIYALDSPHGKGFVREEQFVISDKNDPGTRALQTLTPVVVTDRDLNQFSQEMRELATAEGVKTVCFIPLVNRGRALGVLAISRTTEESFSQHDIEFLSQASGQIAIAVENALAFREISDLKDKLAQEKVYLEEEIRSGMNFEQIIGDSPSLRKILKRVETVAPTDSTVLIYGETGTGKELVARAIHDLSPRCAKPFVKLNCAAIPTGLLESELFGHEKGAFTGAIAQRIGRFEVANGGTIFLDEIGEIPLELQTKLLRVLQEREFERLGSSRTLRTNARLIAATNRDLEAMVGEQKFRSDLFFRLNVFPVQVPPLRDRQGDIPLLVRHFAQQFSKRMNKVIDTIPSATMDVLCRYHWPGNIRELQNVIERAVITSAGPVLRVDVADVKISKTAPLPEKTSSTRSTNGALRDVLEGAEREQILKALKQSNWVVAGPNGAAERLRMKRSTLQLRMNKLGISRHST
jgi:formate hydrogenlyase transcriptional activator